MTSTGHNFRDPISFSREWMRGVAGEVRKAKYDYDAGHINGARSEGFNLVNHTLCQPPELEGAIDNLTLRIDYSPESAAKPRRWSDFGNADRMLDYYGREVRKTTDATMWHWFNGQRWTRLPGSDSSIMRLLARRSIEYAGQFEAPQYEDEEQRDKFLSWLAKQERSAIVSAMINMFSAKEEIFCEVNDFDQKPYLFNCTNGVLDLRTGKMAEHDPDLMITQMSKIAYDPDAECPRWMKFLEEVQPNPKMREYLGEVMGYTLTGSTAEEAVFIHHGHGKNGKSVFMQVIAAIMGDYHQVVAKSALLSRGKDGSIPNDLARIVGKRLLEMQETNAGEVLDNERVKSIASGNRTAARYLNAEFFEFDPVGKIHIVTNFLPNLGTGGFSMERRIHDIGWDVIIPEAKQDKHLAEKIIAEELPGILAWAVRGSMAWWESEDGLVMPDFVKAKVRDHVRSGDPLANWIDDNVTENAKAGWLHTLDVHTNYRTHHHDNTGEEKGLMSIKIFPVALEERIRTITRIGENGMTVKCRGKAAGCTQGSQCRLSVVKGIDIRGLQSARSLKLIQVG